MPSSQDKVSILLVDDDEKKLLTLEVVLAEFDVEIIAVRSGQDALRKLLSQEFALILLDVNMPGMDGFETASLIRQRQNCESIPIIFITAYGDDMFVERGYSLGAVDFILAPIVPDVLRSKVAVFVELYRQTQKIRRQADRLQQRAAQLSALANQLTEAEHRERRRLAQILHDHLQQLLVAAKMRLSAARPRIDCVQLRGTFDTVDKLLDESIGTSRSLTVELSPPMLHDGGLNKALDWLARKFHKDHGLQVHLHAPDEDLRLPEHVLSLLFQAARELLFNVVKHAGVREAWIRVEQVANGVRVVVEDQGSGFRSGPVPKHPGAADHFGLFSIRERLLFLGGDLNIHTSDGQGTRITMTVPTGAETSVLADDDASISVNGNGSASPTLAPPPQPADGLIRVLLVDDHQILRKGLAGLLSAHPDIEVVAEAADGEQAMKVASDLRPDVVVMDVNMPKVNGIEATRRITSSLPNVQVIGLSMIDSAETAQAICEAGAVSYLNKAGPPDQLVAAIRATRDAVLQ